MLILFSKKASIKIFYQKVIQKAYYKLKKTLTKTYYIKRYSVKNFNEILDIIRF